MAKLIMGFMLMMLSMSMLANVIAGSNGINATVLTANVTSSGLVLTVTDTTGYYDVDYVTVGDEDILYDSKDATHFYVNASGRGYNGTQAVAHTSGDTVYTTSAGIFNHMVGYNVNEIATQGGFFAFLNIGVAFVRLLINILFAPIGFFGTDLQFITYIWSAMVTGLIITIGIYISGQRQV